MGLLTVIHSYKLPSSGLTTGFQNWSGFKRLHLEEWSFFNQLFAPELKHSQFRQQ
jgi:hypothetical protein